MVRRPPMSVRSAGQHDCFALGELLHAALDHAPSSWLGPEDLDRDRLEAGRDLLETAGDKGHDLLVVDVEEGLAGLALVAPKDLARESHVADLAVLVHPGARRSGLGSALVAAALESARRRDDVLKVATRIAAGDEALRRTIARSGPFRRERVEREALAWQGRHADLEVWGLWIGPESP